MLMEETTDDTAEFGSKRARVPGESLGGRSHGGVPHGSMELSTVAPHFWTPNVDESLEPCVGRRFKTLSEGVHFYMSYALSSGFDVRHSTLKRGRDGKISMRYLVCSRQGLKGGGTIKPTPVLGDQGGHDKQRRRRISNRVQCQARICLRMGTTGEFVVSIFEDKHTHPLCSEASRQFMRSNRQLDATQQAFIANCIKANIGTSQTFRLYKEVVGSYENIGATRVEFHNFKRDLQAYVEGVDGEMIIKKFNQKREVLDGFFFDYHLDEENRLARLFWADPVARTNFKSFGDAISFDATYGTNRYCLVFVPFTGVDNHRRCITFGAGLLTKEDVDSYVWLLEKFKAAMCKSPLCVVTDQDPAMRIAVERVLPDNRHRFCMWHIMMKVSEKVGGDLAKDEIFRKKLNNIVWSDSILIEEFEVQWRSLMGEYNLVEHRWFIKLYAERMFWIPAYFVDIPMSGLLRTTSRSKGENNAYGKFTHPHCSLVEFYMQFESVLESQRHRQAKLNAECEGYSPDFKTPLALERYAAELYTLSIFYELQTEIIAGCFFCRVVSIRENQGCFGTTLKGVATRHMFLVFKDAQLEAIPPQYVVNRRCKQPTPELCNDRCIASSSPRSSLNLLWTEINTCVAMVGSNEGRMTQLVEVMKELKAEFILDGSSTDTVKGNSHAIEALCGVRPPQSISIKPPAQAKNKGSGKSFKSKRELAIEAKDKGERKCAACGLYGRHDSRNCVTVPRVCPVVKNTHTKRSKKQCMTNAG